MVRSLSLFLYEHSIAYTAVPGNAYVVGSLCFSNMKRHLDILIQVCYPGSRAFNIQLQQRELFSTSGEKECRIFFS
jgi:hypothetical protein